MTASMSGRLERRGKVVIQETGGQPECLPPASAVECDVCPPRLQLFFQEIYYCRDEGGIRRNDYNVIDDQDHLN